MRYPVHIEFNYILYVFYVNLQNIYPTTHFTFKNIWLSQQNIQISSRQYGSINMSFDLKTTHCATYVSLKMPVRWQIKTNFDIGL